MEHANQKEARTPRLQVALDVESMDDALAISKKVADYVDIIEAGTPLIKSEGMGVIQAIKEAHPNKLVCADLKTADAGYLEVKMAAKAKADIISILADAYKVTIEEALRAAYDFNVEIMADLIMSRAPPITLASIMDLYYKNIKIHYALVHSGLDRQASRRAPFYELESVARIRDHPRLAIAGGIREGDISKLLSYPLSIIIVGGGITRSKNPAESAERIRKVISNYYDRNS
ncbi:MAG: orotidine 5'-phosphate decarboxylase / HUMPS family protein [Candidatus Lokiarchaeia archaeon]|nr:orotidine 5'-phosphate decarboxylase / HUMPS family protein [Candidatus Lokiarchaeia archaeon]